MRPSSPRNLFLRPSLILLVCGTAPAVRAESPRAAKAPPAPARIENIKAYCLDFNWAPTRRRGRPFAKPGQWAGADPARHVAWYKAMGANVIQTFCVSTNGCAWYKGGFVPEQPGIPPRNPIRGPRADGGTSGTSYGPKTRPHRSRLPASGLAEVTRALFELSRRPMRR